jgi:Zn-dependent oligopeptidase
VAAVLSMSAGVAVAQDAPMFAKDPALDSFIYSNVVSVFYHEFGHALIDVLLLPVLGRQ